MRRGDKYIIICNFKLSATTKPLAHQGKYGRVGTTSVGGITQVHGSHYQYWLVSLAMVARVFIHYFKTKQTDLKGAMQRLKIRASPAWTEDARIRINTDLRT